MDTVNIRYKAENRINHFYRNYVSIFDSYEVGKESELFKEIEAMYIEIDAHDKSVYAAFIDVDVNRGKINLIVDSVELVTATNDLVSYTTKEIDSKVNRMVLWFRLFVIGIHNSSNVTSSKDPETKEGYEKAYNDYSNLFMNAINK